MSSFPKRNPYYQQRQFKILFFYSELCPFFNLDFLSSIKHPTAENWHPHVVLLFFSFFSSDNCDAENNGQHFQHPYDCHLYTECNDNGIIFVRPCYDDCPVFNNNTLVNCGECSSSCATT